jgi:hypothetical protein
MGNIGEAWITAHRLGNDVIAQPGSLTVVLSKKLFDKIALLLVALPAESLLDGALFPCCPSPSPHPAIST